MVHAFIVTFAVVDWVMSLEPDWFSTMFGLDLPGWAAPVRLAFGIIMLMWIADEDVLARSRAQRECWTWAI